VTRNVGKYLFVCEIAEHWRAVFFREQGRPAKRETARPVNSRLDDRMTDRASYSFVIEFSEGRLSFAGFFG
jgi:hypothetical protein